MTDEVEVQRGKRRAARRFEWFALAVTTGTIFSVEFGYLEASAITALTSFGSTIFLICLGYAAALRGIDSWANEIVKRKG